MANAVTPKYKQSLLDADSNVDLDDGTVKAVLLASTYTYSSAHDFYDDISADVVGTPTTITNTTVTNGLFDGDDVTFTAVPGTTLITAIGIIIDTGVSATSPYVAYLDTGVTGLPVTSNGGDITVTWNASGIFQL